MSRPSETTSKFTHTVQNHLAQGAATSMEDGAFLGRVLTEVVRGVLSLEEAIHVYEKTRMPRVWLKQQTSFAMGALCTYWFDLSSVTSKNVGLSLSSVTSKR